MEALRSKVPQSLRQIISKSSANEDDLTPASSSLLHFFLNLDLFHQVVSNLANRESSLCGKDKDAALQSKRKGNDCFSRGDYTDALTFYSQALRVVPIDAIERDINLMAMLFLNRACVLHKMGLLRECLRDCNRALAISPDYAKAWYRRGKTNASLENYNHATLDLTLSRKLEHSSAGKRQIENELKSLLGHHKETDCSVDEHKYSSSLVPIEEQYQIKYECISTPTKGRGMAALSDIPQASLLHTEEPFAVIISKQCKETHCHYCLNELPLDFVPCVSCSIPLYCSRLCQLKSGGQTFGNNLKIFNIHSDMSGDLAKHIAEVALCSDPHPRTDWVYEHKHECQGLNWPAVLPSEIVLAGRVLVKSVKQRRHSRDYFDILNLSDNYGLMDPESKLEIHIYSIVLLYCLQHSFSSELQLNGINISKLVILISQIRMNSMAIARIKSADVYKQPDESAKVSDARGSITNSIKQVRVGQAIYSIGSLFNHSCQPNIHAYFLSRTLIIRSTEFVEIGHPLELSYGPQLGQSSWKDRERFLEDHYSFKCQCSGCSELNTSDLVLNAFRCANPNCFGIVLNSDAVSYLVQKIYSSEHPQTFNFDSYSQVERHRKDEISKFAKIVFEPVSHHHIKPGICLNCNSRCDLESADAAVKKACIHMRRLQHAIESKDVSYFMISEVLSSLNLLRSTLHAYNKVIAEAEDTLAQALCLVGELQLAVVHCKVSVEILEKLYSTSHIAIGYELIKFSTLLLALTDCSAIDSIRRLRGIFWCYYGSHAEVIFPFLQSLEEKLS